MSKLSVCYTQIALAFSMIVLGAKSIQFVSIRVDRALIIMHCYYHLSDQQSRTYRWSLHEQRKQGNHCA